MDQNTPPPHIRLLNLLSALRDLSPFDLMSAEDEDLLRDLLVRWHEADDIPVSAVMNSMHGVSPTTAYRRLISLRDKGLIRLRQHKSDKRIKCIDPTQLAYDYENRISVAIEQVKGSCSQT